MGEVEDEEGDDDEAGENVGMGSGAVRERADLALESGFGDVGSGFEGGLAKKEVA